MKFDNKIIVHKSAWVDIISAMQIMPTGIYTEDDCGNILCNGDPVIVMWSDGESSALNTNIIGCIKNGEFHKKMLEV